MLHYSTLLPDYYAHPCQTSSMASSTPITGFSASVSNVSAARLLKVYVRRSKRPVPTILSVPSTVYGNNGVLLASFEACPFVHNEISLLGFHPEVSLDVSSYQHYRLSQLLKNCHLLKLFSFLKKNNATLVKELYDNLYFSVGFPHYNFYYCVYARGKVIRFSPWIIEKFMGYLIYKADGTIYPLVFLESLDYNTVASTLTRGRMRNGSPCTRLSSGSLSAMYFSMFMYDIHSLFPMAHDAIVIWTDATLLYAIGLGIPLIWVRLSSRLSVIAPIKIRSGKAIFSFEVLCLLFQAFGSYYPFSSFYGSWQ
ncbi:hypothetical protein Syun_013971 [Stephania yunnanensis]|uniref:Uncharacterized protein n=1 Tax=Stephania yunnanensis TaxID=152371 RepID=A0AAP0JJI6_9MAGN